VSPLYTYLQFIDRQSKLRISSIKVVFLSAGHRKNWECCI